MSFTVYVCIKVSFWRVWGEPGLEWVKRASQRSLANLELTKNLPLYNLCVWYSSRIVFYECNFQPQPSINIFRKQCSATKVRVGRNCSWALAVITILMCACFLTCFVHIGNSAFIVQKKFVCLLKYDKLRRLNSIAPKQMGFFTSSWLWQSLHPIVWSVI